MKYLIIFFVLLLGCSKRQSIGMKSHTFGKKGKHVVWIHVPGLATEHLALLKLTRETTDQKVSLENFECVGATWGYNLYTLRPDGFNGFLSQMLGSKNIQGKCEDFDRKGVWSYFKDSGYEIGLMESDPHNQKSVTELSTCSNPNNPFKDVFIWTQQKGTGSFSSFHYQESTGLNEPGTFYDKSCQKGKCYVSFRTNVENMWPQFKDKRSKTFFSARYLEVQNAIERKDISLLKEALYELDKTISFFQEKKKNESLLIVVSSSVATPIILPSEGKDWASYEKRGKNIVYQRPSILGNSWAMGDGSENFCGTYEESEIYKRFLWMPEEDFFDAIL